MGLKIYSRHGGAAAAGLDDITARVPVIDGVPGTPIVQMGMSVQNGGASQGTLIVPDPVGNLDASLYFPPHNLIIMSEDASGDELILAQGRISNYEIGRAPGSSIDHAVEWTMTVDDANVDLRGLAFTEDWVRPAETGVDRLYALADYTLAGTSSTRPNFGGVISYRPSTSITIDATHLAPNSDTVAMPAKTYPAGTQPMDVVNDVATTEGKVYGVVLHHVGGVSHLCLLYILETDHATYPSAVKISDQVADWDPDDLTAPVFNPIWDQGKGQRVDGNAHTSGIVSRYGPDDKVVTLLSAVNGDAVEYWNEAYQDGASVDAAQAAARAAAIVVYRRLLQETDSLSLRVLPTQAHLLTAGMSLQVKAAPINTGNDSTVGTYVDRRIVSCQWEPYPDGTYHAILQLNRGTRAASGGQSQPASTSPKPAPLCLVPDPGGVGDVVAGMDLFCPTGEGVPDSCGGLSGDVCRNGSLPEYTAYAAIAPGTYYSEIQMGTKYAEDGVDVATFSVRVRDSSFVLPDLQSVLDSTTMIECRHGGGWYTLAGTFEVPTGYDEVLFITQMDGGFWVLEDSHVVNEYTPPASPVEDDPYCISDGGSSPYYARSDDPRLLAVEGLVEDGRATERRSTIGASLIKRGQVLEHDASIASEANRIDSPTIFWDWNRQRWGMVYTGYSESGGSPLQASLHLAYSDDLIAWEKFSGNPILEASGSGSDSNGCTGGYIYDADYPSTGVYHLFSIGLTANGYEGGTKTLNHYTASDPQGTWTPDAANPVISPSGGSTWYSDAIWHPNIVKVDDTYYMFLNATGTISAVQRERIGYATNADLDGDWTVNATHVLAPTGTGTDWDGEWIADPSLYRVGPIWYMAYGGKGTDAQDHGQDGIAWTTVDDFPTGWTRWEGNPVLGLGDTDEFDQDHAHKPFIVSTPDGLFHFYTATDADDVWSFGLGVSGAVPTLNVEGHTHPAAGAIVLDDLSDVVITSVADGEVLTYDSGSGDWVNATVPSTSGIGEILISDTPSTPLIFADLLQNEAQDDLLYADP